MKTTELPKGVVAVKWNNAERKYDDICVECSVLRNKIFRIGSDEFKELVPPPIHDDCGCYLTFVYEKSQPLGLIYFWIKNDFTIRPYNYFDKSKEKNNERKKRD